jgi:pyruvate ferredoxin oxidoreductase alpha subunit
MVTFDGFIISHAMEVVDVEDDAAIRQFVGTYKPPLSLLDLDHPITMGALDFTDYYFEHRRSLAEPIGKVKDVVLEVAADFKKAFGREYRLFDTYKLDDAEYAIVVLGSTAGTAKVTIDALRERGVKAGMLKVRMFRPFPYDDVAEALEGKKAVAVLDRSDGLAGRGGPVFGEVRSAICDWPNKPITVDYVYGLGGRDIGPELIEIAFNDLQDIAKTGKARNLVSYLGVRE